MTAPDVNSEIEAIIETLCLPVTVAEGSAGWTYQSKEAALKYFVGLQQSLKLGGSLPPLGIVRGLDHWGVNGGELLESIAKTTNALRQAHASM